jgi:AmmeMemoRadiSam system protein B/AmmeMemoRadiSam system protein A
MVKSIKNIIFVLFIIWTVGGSVKEVRMIREPVVSGQFYPEKKEALAKTIDELFKKTPQIKSQGKIVGIIVPHAGYPYSGPTAAYAYKAISKEHFDAVIMLGPSHHVYLTGFSIYGQGVWRTPLGEVLIDEELAQSLIKENSKIIKNQPEAHRSEHSLEVQLPFLQTVLQNFRILPIMMLEPSYEDCEKLAQAIAKVSAKKKVLLLASSDLYHGYSYTQCQKTDSVTLSYIENLEPLGLYKALKNETAQACGGYPIVVLLLTAKALGANKAQIIHHTNSNDVTGEIGGYCVGYASGLVLKKEDTLRGNELFWELTEAEKKELLKIARTSIEQHLNQKPLTSFSVTSDKLKEKCGVFVTIKKHGELRGCIGYIEGVAPLYKAVSEMAIAAATKDPRFPPVNKNELPHISLEITILSPLKKITDINEIEIGKHGLVIKRGYNQGLLLPQVATEYGWDRETFLEHTCWKAGLPDNAWKDPKTEIYIFSGIIISEEK